MGGHDWGAGFDKSRCETCKHLETNRLGAKTCGLCGCFISLMGVARTPPSDCPHH